jgi:hypothetical protein
MITKQQLIEKRNAVCDQLIAEGWDYDDARAATMTAGSTIDEQPEAPAHLALAELTAMTQQYRTEQTPIEAAVAQESKAAAAEAMERAQQGKMRKGDGGILVRAGLAQYTYDDPESNRPTGIAINAGDGNPYADSYDA